MGDSPWTRQVIGRGETFIANKTEEFSGFFSDYALINELGCEAAMNIPIAQDGRVVGTVNVLDAAGHFTPRRVKTLQKLVNDNNPELLEAFASVPMEDGS